MAQQRQRRVYNGDVTAVPRAKCAGHNGQCTSPLIGDESGPDLFGISPTVGGGHPGDHRLGGGLRGYKDFIWTT